MAFEVSGMVIAEGLIDTVAADAAFELMPIAMESLSTVVPEAFAGFGGETLGSIFGSEAVPGVIQQAVTPAAQGVIEGGVGAGEGITAATKGAIDTGAAASGPFAQTAPMLDYVEPAVSPVPVPEGAPTMQPVNATNTFNPEVRPGMELTDTGFQPTGEVSQPSGIEQVKATPGQGGVLNADGTVTTPDGSKVPWEEYSKTQGFDPSIKPPTPDSGFMQGFSEFVDKHPFLTGAGIYGVASATGMLNQKPQNFSAAQGEKFNNPYRFSSNFQASHPEPNVYKPSYAGYAGSGYAGGGITQATPPTPGLMDGGQPARVDFMGKDMYPMSQQDNSHYATPSQMPTSAQQTMASYEANTNPLTGEMTMASGGIAHYYRGELATSTGGRGDVYGATSRFLDMYDPASRYQAPADASKPDVGIFHDTNPNTRDKSALDAATMRQNALAKRAQVNTGAKYYKPSIGMGQISVSPQKQDDGSSDSVLAASGGIMGANLGGYAAGGNPRLLRGPGDGMSDNIPATIGGRQPARLADGEFVVPADVVSHLGNGSTEAGAKRLHQMMDQVRMDRTGKKKQAPAVKAGKYIPK
jgi:hypothetical protein